MRISIFLILFLLLTDVATAADFVTNSSTKEAHVFRAGAAKNPDNICTLEMARTNPASCYLKKSHKKSKKKFRKKSSFAPQDFDSKVDATSELIQENDFVDGTKFEFRQEDGYLGDEFYDFAPLMLEDPFEEYNRKIYSFNEGVDLHIYEPVAKAYEAAIPKPARKSVKNFLSNASLPMSFFNSLLQGEWKNMMSIFSNLLINTTVGIGGIFDVAGSKGIKYHKENFSNTLENYGVGPGPYLVVPFLGSSSARDLLGFTFDKAIDPSALNVAGIGGESGSVIGSNYYITMFLVSGVDRRETVINLVDEIRKKSLDPYTAIKGIYSNVRAKRARE